MDFNWYFELPDFKNLNEWAEVKIMDLYFDPKKKGVLEDRAYGCAEESLLIGMVIIKKSIQDPSLRLMEYRLPDGKGPFALRWWDERAPERYGVALFQDGAWQIRGTDEEFRCVVNYDRERCHVVSAYFYFKKIKLPPSSN